jgi:hypothetical protein
VMCNRIVRVGNGGFGQGTVNGLTVYPIACQANVGQCTARHARCASSTSTSSLSALVTSAFCHQLCHGCKAIAAWAEHLGVVQPSNSTV